MPYGASGRLAGAAFALLATTTLAGAQLERSWVDPPARRPPVEASPPAEEAAEPVRPRLEFTPEPQPRAEPTPTRPSTRAEPVRPPARPPSPPPRRAEPARPPSPAPKRAEPRRPPAPPPVRAERPRPTSPPVARREPSRPPAPDRSEQAQAAIAFAREYLAFWSAPNALALEATPDFYADRVRFHGQVVSARALFEEKRRFARRWPIREYRHRAGTLAARCSVEGDRCTVSSVFDFEAVSPEAGRRSVGTGRLTLVVVFAGSRPVIVAETSAVEARGPRSAALDDDD